MTAAADLDADVDLVHVHPRDLIIGPNVRRDPQYEDLVASVREVGVQTPISAYWDTDGDLVVVLGQRRTLAAIEADQDTVPVYVIPKPDDVNRLVDQYVENAHREDLTTADVVDTWHQLETLGLDEITIAQRTTTPLDQVRAGLKIAHAPGAVGTIRKYPQTTLDQAVVLADFEGNKTATNKLVKAIEEDTGFEHVAQRLVDERAAQQLIDALATEIREAGGVVIDEQVSWYASTKDPIARLTALRGADDQTLTVSAHEKCDGHAAFIELSWEYDANTKANVRKAQAVHVCLDWQKYGHTAPSVVVTGGAATAPVKLTKAQKAEKARVDAGDAAWVSATTVRRNWLDELSRRGTPPAGAERYLLEQFLSDELPIEWEAAPALRALGRDVPADTEDLEHPFLVEHKPARITVCLVWMVLAGMESYFDQPDTWRTPWRLQQALPHLRALAGFGYELARIEQAVVDGETWQPDPA